MEMIKQWGKAILFAYLFVMTIFALLGAVFLTLFGIAAILNYMGLV